MPYPRAQRTPPATRDVDVDAHAVAFDADEPRTERIDALWSLAGASSSMRVGALSLAQRLGALLNEPNVVAFEAYEALAALFVDVDSAGRPLSALDELAVGVDRGGQLFVPDARFREHVADEDGNAFDVDHDVPVVRLRDIQRLASRSSAFVVSWPRIVPGVDLVVERAATSTLRPRAVRIRGDDALVGGLGRSVLRLPTPRRHLRFRRRDHESWMVSDLYGEGLLELRGRVLQHYPSPIADGDVIQVMNESGDVVGRVIARFAPRLERSAARIRVNVVEHGEHEEQLAEGEALFFGPDVDDDYWAPRRVRLLQMNGLAFVTASGALDPADGDLGGVVVRPHPSGLIEVTLSAAARALRAG